MTNAHDPRPPHAIADDPRVPTGRDDRMRDAARLQDADAAIHRVTFRNTAEVDAHAFLRELHAMRLLVEDEVPVVHPGQGLLDLLFGRLDVLAVVVEVP